MNTKNWFETLKASPKRVALPIMTHPGIELIGKSVRDAVTSGEIHFEAIRALNEKYPQSAAVTVIMDLTVEAEAFGAHLTFPQDEVPSVTERLVCDYAGVEALTKPSLDAGRIGEYLKANRLAAEQLEKPVFGGCIGPFSLAGRLYDMTEIMMAIYTEPETAMLLLDKCTDFLTDYCLAIKQTGVAGVIMAEPAAGLLSNDDCAEYSSKYVRRIIEAVQDDSFAVVLHNCGNTGHCTLAMTSTGAMAYHFGNKIDMEAALRDSPAETLVMGNIDPVGVIKQASATEVAKAVAELLERTAAYPNFILSTGCDVPPGIPQANIEAFYDELARFNSRA